MRLLICSAALLSACSQEPTVPGVSAGLFAGKGRNALCISGAAGDQRGGFIIYGRGNENCSARGRIVEDGAGFALVPQGEGDCRIPLTQDAAGVTLGNAPASCSYYCGPGAALDGAAFRQVGSGDAAASNPMVDFAGDPLC